MASMADQKKLNPGFWNELNKPFFALAPMYDVTDVAFRELLIDIAKPDIFFTEFINCDAFVSERGKHSQLEKLKFTQRHHPIVAQIWGNNPETFFITAKEVSKMGFDGIDINMGCPEKSEVKIGACAALIKNQPLAKEIIEATIKGSSEGTGIPVSVKTRIGFNVPVTEEWARFLLGFDLAAITIHGRTAKQMSQVPADWNEIQKVVDLKNKLYSPTLIIGNGDVKNYNQGMDLAHKHGLDGIMIGRGIFENLWAFSKDNCDYIPSKNELLEIMKKHINLHNQYQPDEDYNILKKFFKIYIRGFDGASDLRVKVMETKNSDDALGIIGTELQKNVL